MRKRKLLIPIFAGLIVGQIFAEGSRPFSLINTFTVGYNDNIDRTEDAKGSAFVKDTIDLAFNESFSDRTDLVVKSRLVFQSDREDNFKPNLYAVLSHSVSPRLMFQFSEYLKSGEKTSGRASGRYDYYDNTLGVVSTYVVTDKDRIELSLNHRMRWHDKEIENENFTSIGGGIAWERDIRPQRTRMKLSLRQSFTEYDKRDLTALTGVTAAGLLPPTPATVTRSVYDSKKSSYSATEPTLEVAHTFNQQWQGSVEVGVTYVRKDYRDYIERTVTVLPIPVVVDVQKKANNDASLEPFFKLGLVYSPSPRTRVTGDFSQRYQESNDSQYGAQTSRELRLGVQHDLTAKILAKATARFRNTEYSDADDEAGGTTTEGDKERFDLDLSLSYKLNRLNFLELGLRHSETAYDDGVGDWDQNIVDVGWRVEL